MPFNPSLHFAVGARTLYKLDQYQIKFIRKVFNKKIKLNFIFPTKIKNKM
jgi:hypothetical protein